MQRTTTYPDSSAIRSNAEALGEQAHGGIDRLTSTAHQAVERATSAAANAADTLGVALAAGYLLSRILSSR